MPLCCTQVCLLGLCVYLETKVSCTLALRLNHVSHVFITTVHDDRFPCACSAAGKPHVSRTHIITARATHRVLVSSNLLRSPSGSRFVQCLGFTMMASRDGALTACLCYCHQETIDCTPFSILLPRVHAGQTKLEYGMISTDCSPRSATPIQNP